MSMGGPLEVHGRSMEGPRKVHWRSNVHGRSTEGPWEVHWRSMESTGGPRRFTRRGWAYWTLPPFLRELQLNIKSKSKSDDLQQKNDHFFSAKNKYLKYF